MISKIKLYAIFLFNILLCVSVAGQEIVISGNIKFNDVPEDSDKPNATICVVKDKKNKYFTTSNIDGDYKLIYKYEEDLVIEFRSLGYKSVLISLKDEYIQDNKMTINCTLEIEPILLNAITVKPDNIEQDTVNINLSKYNLKESDNLNNILSKNPNFSVDDEGSIIYKGKNINRILVDGEEFFRHQNSIALDKIEKRMIEGVQIINNYSDKFSIDNTKDNETVLNLKSNKDLNSLLIGSITGGYGFNDKFDAQTAIMSFSKRHNGFITSNNNNLGQSTMNHKDLMSLLGSYQPISIVQSKILNEIFTAENRKKDFASTTNLSYTFQSNSNRLKLMLYFLNRNRENNITEEYEFTNEANYSSTNLSNISSKSNAIFSSINYDRSITDKQVFSYNISSTLLYPKQNVNNSISTTNSSISDVGNTVENNNFKNLITNYGFNNRVQYDNKLLDKLLLTLRLGVYNERSESMSTISLLYNESQNIDYAKDFADISLNLIYTLKKSLSLSAMISPDFNNEKLYDSFDNREIKRRIFTNKFNIALSGKGLWDKIDYRIIIGENYYKWYLNDRQFSKRTVPMNLMFTYENRLNRLYLSCIKSQQLSTIQHGINEFDNNKLVYGDLGNIESLILTDKVVGGYSYNSFISGRTFNAQISYNRIKNSLQPILKEVLNGIFVYELWDVTSAAEIEAKINGGFMLLNQTSFPIKSILSTSYKLSESHNTDENNNVLNLKEQNVIGSIGFKSISKGMVNFESNLKYMYATNSIEDKIYSSHYIQSNYTLWITKDRIEGYLKYIFNTDIISQHQYSRKNIDVSLLYKYNTKLHFCIEGKNIDQFIGLFNNQSYSTRFSISNGISRTVINTAIIPYLIIKLKFNI